MLTLWWRFMEKTFVGQPKKHLNFYFETWQGKKTFQFNDLKDFLTNESTFFSFFQGFCIG